MRALPGYKTFGWYYMLVIVAYLVFVVFIGMSRFGVFDLGPTTPALSFAAVVVSRCLPLALKTCCFSAGRAGCPLLGTARLNA